MATTAGRSVIRHLSRAAVLSDDVPRHDAELLGDFIARRDEAAFTALVRRHGSMVLAVCRRVVGHRDDADDAFQATFLVLARKAGSIADRDLLANWLYGVAYRTALEARTRMLRRSAAEKTLPDFPDPIDEPGEDNAELLALLDRELNRLADKYRVPVVLCELEGRSRREAAELLGIPEGTLSSRLAAARRMLAERLTRRGIAVSVAAVTAALSQREASASVPASLIARAVAGATANSAAPTVAELTQGVLKTMLLRKLTLTAGVSLLALSGAFVTIGLASAQPDDPPKQPALTDKPPAAKPKEGKGTLVGGWKILTVNHNGREIDPDQGGPKAMYFTKDKCYMLSRDGLRGTFTHVLDVSHKPAHITLVASGIDTRGPEKLAGIFELAGDDLKIAFAEGRDADEKRPESFEVKEGSRVAIVTLKRDSDVKEPDRKTAEEQVKNAGTQRISENNMKQIGLAMHNYASVHNKLPTHAIYSKDGKPLLSWRVAILPYLDQEQLYKQFNLDEPWDSEHNKALIEKMPKTYGAKGTETHYRVFTGKDAMFQGQKAFGFADIRDGTSNTIMLVEGADTVSWTKPEDYEYDAAKPLPKLGGKPWENGFLIALADGSVRMLPTQIPEKTLRALITPAGDEKIDLDPKPEKKKKD